MINIISGAVVFDDNLSIDATTQLSGIASISSAKVVHSVPERTQLSLGSHEIQGHVWGVGVIFVQTKLNQIWLQLLNADGVDAIAWSLENEKIRKFSHDSFVKKLCSSSGDVNQSISSLVYKFSWGKISSVLDIRGVQALIVFEYL